MFQIVTNCYKAAVDAYLESPEKFEAIKQDLIDEMWKVAQRELATVSTTEHHLK